MKRRRTWCMLGLFCAGLFWQCPLFHLVPLAEVAAVKDEARFDAAEFATEFWSRTLVPSFAQATDARELCALVQSDPSLSQERFGHSVGLSRVVYFYLRGEGTIVEENKSGVALSLIAPDDQPDVVLKSGLLFGNTVRDATKLLNASDFGNSQHFSAISTELNRIVESDVLPRLRKEAALGKRVQFVGCAEIRKTSKSFLPLQVVPLQLIFR